MKIARLIFVILICQTIAFAQKTPIVVYLAGDSTLAEKKADKRPETGWGEMLQQYFDGRKVKIDNRAEREKHEKFRRRRTLAGDCRCFENGRLRFYRVRSQRRKKRQTGGLRRREYRLSK